MSNSKINHENMRNNFARWRRNPHLFAEEYLGLDLFLFQYFLLWAMNKFSFFMYIASRGQGKSYIIAIYSVARAILYPNSNIVLASGTRGQARLIITEKILNLKSNSPNLAREIAEFKTGANETYVLFKNGSKITAVTSGDSARGYRANILIVDEFRLVPKHIIDEILIPFLNVNRTPPYLKKPEYAHLTEENKEIYISSSWYKNHYMWLKFKSYMKNMLKSNSEYFVAVLPYQLSIFHKLLSKKRVIQQMTADDFDQMSFDMEYEALFVGESENAYYKLDDIQSCRILEKPFYPPTSTEYVENAQSKRKKKLGMKKQKGEIRLIGLDIAMMNSSKALKNDTTAFTLMRLLPDGDTYTRDVVYLESMNGGHTDIQAIRLKQLFYDFETDYVVMDTNGNGLAIYDACSKVLYDSERDVEYPSWTALNNDSMDDRKLDKNAVPVVYSVKATSELNHHMAIRLRTSLEKRKMRLLSDDVLTREDLVTNKKLLSKSTDEQYKIMKPFVTTTALQNELVNLVYQVNNGYIKIVEVGTTTKDRYSSLAYCNYYATELEKELSSNGGDEDFLEYCFI